MDKGLLASGVSVCRNLITPRQLCPVPIKGFTMGRIINRAAMREKQRQLQIDAVLNADPSTIVKLPSMASRQFRRESTKKPTSQGSQRRGYGPGSGWEIVMEQRLAKQPTPQQVEKELMVREANVEARKVLRRKSGIFTALKGS
jgi:hypothetical protein